MIGKYHIGIGWVLVAVYAFGRLSQLWADRWPTPLIVALHVIPPALFAILHGSLLYRVKGMLVFTLFCLGTGAVCENLSLHTGFPFGHYVFTEVMGPKCLGLPVLLVLAYLGIGYVSWVLSLLILRQQNSHTDGTRRLTVPLLASAIMLAWDLAMEADWSTVDRAWLWRDGGVYFGVPVSNFLGWYLTAFLFYAAFAAYLRTRPVRIPSARPGFWQSAIAVYAVCAAGNLLLFAKPMAPRIVFDPSGASWKTLHVLIADALVSLFVMESIAVLAWLRARQPADPL